MLFEAITIHLYFIRKLREISDIVIFYKIALYQIEEDKLLPLFSLNNKVINAFAILLIIAMILTILSEREIRKLI